MCTGRDVAPGFLAFCQVFLTRRTPPLVLAFLLVNGVVVGEASAVLLDRDLSAGRAAAGAVSFACAFVLLRITDDIDDEGDGRPLWARVRLDIERRLGALGLLVLGVLLATAWLSGTGVVLVAAALVTPLISFLVRPRLAVHPSEPLRVRSGSATVLLAVVYEGVPAMIIASLPLALIDPTVPAVRVTLVAVLGRVLRIV